MCNNYKYLKSYCGALKIFTLIFEAVVLSIGWYSYFQSKWTKVYKEIEKTFTESSNSKPNYNQLSKSNFAEQTQSEELPKLSLEVAALSLISICFICSTINLLVNIIGSSFSTSGKGGPLVDVLYHILGALALFIASWLLISSTINIRNFVNNNKRNRKVVDILQFDNGSTQLVEGKIATGICSAINGIIYTCIAVMIRVSLTTNLKKTTETGSTNISFCSQSTGKDDWTDRKELIKNIKLLMKSRQTSVESCTNGV